MPITQGATLWYANSIKNLSNGKIDLDSHTFKIALLSSAYVFDATNHEFFDLHISGELATGNGYTAGGQVLTGVGWTAVPPDRYKFSTDSPAWAIAGSGLTTRSWVIYDDTPVASKPLLMMGYHDYNLGSPRDVSPTPGNTFTVLVSGDGLFYAKYTNSV
jgi:hypothetical protein